jgi:hypothetical protein
MSIDFAEWYANAKSELEQVQQHRADLQGQLAEDDKKIAALTNTINALAPMVGEEPMAPSDTCSSGITDRIRGILVQAAEPLSPPQIRDLLEAAGCDLKSYSNPLSTIHTVLRRLAEGEEIKEKHLKLDGKKYRAFIGAAGQGRGKFMGVAVVRRKPKEAPDGT